jgi:histidinol-phosphatase (PHP family)
MKYDFHLHTEFSYDSFIKGRELLTRAMELKYDEIAITEHLDLLPQELSVWGLPSLTKYSAYVQALQKEFPDITLHCGIEIGDYHLVKDFAQSLISGFDLFPILGSVHFLSDHSNVAIPLPHPLDKDQITDYYKHNLQLVSTCEIDVLAHLGVYKRYYTQTPDESHAQELIKEIFRVMIARGIALEINFSALSKPYRCVVPEPRYIELYRELGGELFSLGSDAHRLQNFGSTLQGNDLLGKHRRPQK